MSAQCKENHESAILPPVTSSSFFCLMLGSALAQFKVLLLLSFPTCGLSFVGLSRSGSSLDKPFSDGGDLRSFEDLECSSLWLSRSARSFVGDLKALGRDSSSIVLPRDRADGRERDKLRSDMP